MGYLRPRMHEATKLENSQKMASPVKKLRTLQNPRVIFVVFAVACIFGRASHKSRKCYIKVERKS